MAKLTDEMKEMIKTQLAYIATTDENGNPNLGPKRSMRLYDDNTLVYNENTCKQTMNNIIKTGRASVAVANLEKITGFRFSGKAEIQTEGKMYDEAVKWAEGKMGVPKAVGIIHIEKIFDLKSGPTAGEEIV